MSRTVVPLLARRTLVVGLLTLGGLVGSTLLVAPVASADPSAAAWSALRRCESGGSYTIVARNGHYGAYQFDRSTWRSVGGSGSPEQASRLEQDYRALRLYRMRGWQPWTCARRAGLREDADARSGRIPAYAEARAVSGATGAATGSPNRPASGTVEWPGTVYRYGDCASALRTFQLRMNTIGNNAGVPFRGTGCYYAKTRTAVLALQRAHGIEATGTLGPRTWAAAFSASR